MIPEISLSNLKPNDKLEPKDLATKVQGMFVEVMLKAMEDSVEAEDGLFGNSSSSEIYRGMMREQFGAAISGQMQTSLEEQLQKKLTAPVTPANPASEIRN